MPIAILMAVLPIIKAGFEFGTQLLQFLATEKGQSFCQKWLDDDKAFRAAMGNAWSWLKRLFSGELIQFDSTMIMRKAKQPESQPNRSRSNKHSLV